jgi:outer membrane protein assembly factor BamB
VSRRTLTVVLLSALLPAVGARAGDWPMFRADAARTGYTAEPVADGLTLRWSVQERHAPAPAWPSSKRMPYDRAYQVVVAGGTLYYGTSSDGKLVALDAVTGQPRWTFLTDGPVRFAPAVWRDQVFVAGDDGFLYSLAAADGRVRWKLRGGPRPDMLLGNDRMISRWPARGGPVVADGVLYFGAGIWPSEGIFLYAIDAASGRRLWCNDSSGSIEMDQPHPTARAVSGAAAQGHLTVSGDTLLVPTGRAVPAAFDRADGKFRYLHLQANRALGGSEVVAIDGSFFNSGTMFATATGLPQQTLGKLVGEKVDRVVHAYTAGAMVAAHPRWIVYSAGSQLVAIDRRDFLVDKETFSRKGKKIKVKVLGTPGWTTSLPIGEPAALIVAGDRVVAGGKGRVLSLDVATGRTRWSAAVEGTAYGLAAAGGRLYASTDRGMIYCFDGAKSPSAAICPASVLLAPDVGSVYAKAAEEIVARSGVAEGYCLDLACGDGRLSLELARRTKLRIYAVEADPAKVAAARQVLDAAGLYGVRVTVHQGDPAAAPYPECFADLVVSGRSVTEGAEVVPRKALQRFARPWGGVAHLGRPGSVEQFSRGPLEGAAAWTHQYADPANTLCSGDARLRGPLAMLWFRDTDLLMPSRHGRGPAPLVAQGRMFVEGINDLRAVNVYNGSTLWEFPLKGVLAAYHQDHLTGVAATGSNLCLGGNRLFVQVGGKCLALDVKTGRPAAEIKTPPRPDGKPGTWGYIAWRDGILFGSLVNERHVVKESWRAFLDKLDMSRLWSESVLLFALDDRTGKPKWTFAPRHSIRHNTIAVGPGRVYLIDRPPASDDVRQPGPAGADGAKTRESQGPQPTGRMVCLDADSGRVLWETSDDVFGTLLALSEQHGVLLMSYQPTSFKLDSELGGRLAALRASDGARLWDAKAKYKSRPVVNDRTVYLEPGAWDLLTGERLPFQFTRSYGCGILAGSERLLVFRSATLGYRDLQGNPQTVNYGGIRPGCWVNAIPAGGLVLLADAASWCTCSYLNQATIALKPAEPAAGD